MPLSVVGSDPAGPTDTPPTRSEHSRRAQEAIARVRAQGRPWGRPCAVPAVTERTVVHLWFRLRSAQAVAELLTTAGILTATGHEGWHQAQVSRIVRRVLEIDRLPRRRRRVLTTRHDEMRAVV